MTGIILDSILMLLLVAAIGYGIGVFIARMARRFVLTGRSWWPPTLAGASPRRS